MAARDTSEGGPAARSSAGGASGVRGVAWVLAAAVLALLLVLAWLVLDGYARRPPQNDHVLHVRLASRAARGLGWPPHFLFHAVLNALTGFSGELAALRTASAAVLTAAVGARLLLTRRLATAVGARPGPLGTAGLWIAAFLVSPVVNWWMYPRIYLGQFTPTVWHNPTAIAALPFAVAAFVPLARAAVPGAGAALLSGAMLALSALVKPNFALAFLPAVALVGLARRWPLRSLAAALLPTLPVLGMQLVTGFGEERGSGLAFEPLTVWLKFTEIPAGETHALGSLLVSFAFPAGFALLAGRAVADRRPLVLAWLALGVALAQFLLFAETGAWLYHGNFYWGTVPCLYLVFVLSIVELGRLDVGRLGRAGPAVRALLWGLLAAHVASGALFWHRSLQGWMHDT